MRQTLFIVSHAPRKHRSRAPRAPGHTGRHFPPPFQSGYRLRPRPTASPGATGIEANAPLGEGVAVLEVSAYFCLTMTQEIQPIRTLSVNGEIPKPTSALPILSVVRMFWGKTYLRFDYIGAHKSVLLDGPDVYAALLPLIGQRIDVSFGPSAVQHLDVQH